MPVYGGLYKVCQRALAAGTLDRMAARKFFEDNFTPVRIAPGGETQGFFTGYYEGNVRRLTRSQQSVQRAALSRAEEMARAQHGVFAFQPRPD